MLRLTSFLLLINASGVFAQPANREIVNQPLEWFSITNTIKLNKTFSLIAEGQFRFASDFQPMQHQARTGLEIKVSDHFSFIPVAYVYTWNFLYGEQPASFRNNEHRFWQQVMYKHDLGKIKIDHRLRVEERYIQVHSRDADNVVVDEGYDNRQTRFRYRFMARMPLNSAKIEPKTCFASVYDEVFMSRGKTVTFHDPDQNRIFAGMGYQFNPKFTLQGGFLYQMLIKANGAKQENNKGVQIFANYTIDLVKK